MNHKWLPISLFTLAFAILLSGLFIKNAIDDLSIYSASSTSTHAISSELQQLNTTLRSLKSSNTESSPNNGITSLLSNPDTMYLGDAAKYLGISKEDFIQIINDPQSELPFLKTSSDTYIFNKKSLDKWLEKSYTIR